MIETVKDDVELSTEFLDDLFVAIRDKLPGDKWVPITKDHTRVIAGIKYIIDMGCYGLNIDIVFNSKYTHFRKHVYKEATPPFSGMYIDDTACARYDQIARGELDERNRIKERTLRSENRAKQRKRTPNMKKRK